MLKKKSVEVRSMREVDFSDLKFPQIVTYYHPDDDPEACVARVLDNGQPTNVMMRRGSVWELDYDIRNHTNMIFCPRGADDDPVIVGIWV